MAEKKCDWPTCEVEAIGIWVWKATDMDIGLAYCEEHADSVKEKLMEAGRMAGGFPLKESIWVTKKEG